MRILMIPPLRPHADDDAFAEAEAHAAGLRDSGHEVDVLELRLPLRPEAAGPLENALTQRYVAAALRRGGFRRPDVVHALDIGQSAIVAREISIQGNVPYVLSQTLHQEPESGRPGHRRLLRQSVQDASAVDADCAAAAAQLEHDFAIPHVAVRPESGTAIALYEEAIGRFAGEHVLFHAPYPIDPQPSSASRLRPKKMLEAIHGTGASIHRMTGGPRQRALGYSDARRRIRRGARIDYLYSENSTQPNLLATSIKEGLAPFLDARILRFADRRRIPAGQFYRDVYWRFPGSLAGTPLLRRCVMEAAYRFDAAVLRTLRTHVFLPSLPMGPVVPLPEGQYSALPPGCDIHDSVEPDGVKLFYVGGLGPDYGMHMCVAAVAATEGVSLTMVVPPRDWERYEAEYRPLMDDSISVAHARSHELQEYYDRASACVLFVEPTEYREFAVPVKFYEYMSYGKPSLLSAGTLAGEIGEELGTGIVVEHSPEAFTAALERLREDPSILRRAAERAREEREQNTWADRVDAMRRLLLSGTAPLSAPGHHTGDSR